VNGLPSNWATTVLSEICHHHAGNSKLIKGRLAPEFLPHLFPAFSASGQDVWMESFEFDGNAIVVSAVGARCGKSFIAQGRWSAIANTHIVWPNPQALNLKFIWYRLNDEQFWKKSGSAQPFVKVRDTLERPFNLPPRAEQDRIVSEIEKQFTRLDSATVALKRVQANLKRYRTAVLKAACEGRLVPTEAELARRENRSYEHASTLLERILAERHLHREATQQTKGRAIGKEPTDGGAKTKYQEPHFPDTRELVPLPVGWVWARAEQICDFITKGTTPAADKLFAGAGEVPYLKVYNLTDSGTLDFSVNPTFIARTTHERELARSRVFPNDVLMNIVGPPLGKVSIVPPEYPEWNINQAIAIFRPMPSFAVKYFSYCLLSETVLNWAIKRSKATAGQFNLTLEICRDLPIPVPPADEQRRIVAELERRLSVIEEIKLQTNKDATRTQRLRQAILKRAFEGDLVPQNPKDEPADALLERIRSEVYEKPQSQSRKLGKGRTVHEQCSLLPYD
jgi:type I restriction enzyme S subunit